MPSWTSTSSTPPSHPNQPKNQPNNLTHLRLQTQNLPLPILTLPAASALPTILQTFHSALLTTTTTTTSHSPTIDPLALLAHCTIPHRQPPHANVYPGSDTVLLDNRNSYGYGNGTGNDRGGTENGMLSSHAVQELSRRFRSLREVVEGVGVF